jgi:outer membrane protein assembly factor BamD
MLRRILIIAAVLSVLLLAACTNKKVSNPIANIDSKQPDKVLFDRAMDAMKHNRFDVSRLTLQTLINTYPDSEYIARAKLAIADSWYAEGGSASQAQAEIEYKDFITFFPNMPEAAEAQLKIANIHYQQMEKPDRDYTHAMRAEQEYRQLIMQFPDSKLVPEAKQRLREVQEVIAEREFRVGRFYYLRESYPAAIARLRSLVDKYPLYSKADEALYLLGQSYEGEVNTIRARPNCVAFNKPPNCVPEALKARMIEPFNKDAGEAYSQILTRYPLMDRADDAKARLIALHQPVPKPTKAAVALNKAEEDSRKSPSTLSRLMRNFEKHPSVADAARVGEPTLVDPTPMNPNDVVQQATKAMLQPKSSSDNHSVSVEVGKGEPPADQPVPRSDAPPAADNGTPDTSSASATANSAPTAATDQNELKPNAESPDANELKPNVPANSTQALPPPQQVNEIQAGGDQSANSTQASTGQGSDSAASDAQQPASDADVASSKHKKKKGIHKVVPF